jgi:quercetin dioxygenase-like cupin family protein
MEATNVRASFKGLGELEFRSLARFNEGAVGIYWSSGGISPWERHPHDEELLHIIEGQVEIEVLTDAGSEVTLAREGSIFVVPRNHWHRHRLVGLVKELYLTPGPTDTSFAVDPRVETS